MAGFAVVVAFLAGIVSFASPCCLPLVPAYVGYMVGTVPDTAAPPPATALYQALRLRRRVLGGLHRLWASVGLIGYVLRDSRWASAPARRGAARVHGPACRRRHQRRGTLPRGRTCPLGRLAPAGMGFGDSRPDGPRATRARRCSGWCSPPAGRRASAHPRRNHRLASVSTTVVEGTVLLVAYAAGLALPFVLVAVGATSVSRRPGLAPDARAGGLVG